MTVEQMEFVLHGYFWTECNVCVCVCVWDHCYSEEIGHGLIKDLVISLTMPLVCTVQRSDRTPGSLFYLTLSKNRQCTTSYMSYIVFTEKPC